MSTSTTRNGSADDERATRRARDRERMKEAIASLRTSKGWRNWLRARHHFRTYSLANTILIAHQMPDATRVAGFRAWLKLGYCVRKGERSIRIWAPVPPSKKALESWSQAGSHPDDRPRTYFRLVPVFDRSQVDPVPDHPGGPAPLEPPHEPITGDGLERCRPPLVALASDLGSEVTFEPIHGAAAGYHEPATGRIVIDDGPDRSPNAEIQTLVHELTHRLVRHDRREGDPCLDYASEELVAESVAFTVCAGLGLDTAGDSVPYLAGWGGEEATDQIEALAQLIDRLAKGVEDAVALCADPH